MRDSSRDTAAAGATRAQPAGAELRAVFDHVLQFMVMVTPAGVVVDANRAALEAVGAERGDVVGQPLRECAWWSGLPEEQAWLDAAIARAAAGEQVRHELSVQGPAGAATFDFSLTPVPGADGAVSLIVAEGRDVSETKWAERALRVSEAKFAGIISIASDAIISIDENFLITMFNQGAETIFGYRAADVLGQRLELLLPERFRGGHDRHVRDFARSPSVARRMGERQEILGRRADGSEFPAEASISKLDLFGSMVFTVVLRDITERKRAERAQQFLNEAGALLASSLDYEVTVGRVAQLTVPELADWSVVYVREDDGRVRRLQVAHADPSRNEFLRQLFRYPLEPHRPHPVFTVLETGRPEVMLDLGEDFLQALAHDPDHAEIYRTLGLGSMLMVPLVARGETRGAMGFYSAAPRRYGAEELSLAQDLALVSALALDNARLYMDARAAVEARDDLIAVVSHDLGNPLSAIRIGTSLLLRSIPEAEQAGGGWKHLDAIRQSAQQMENLINDLLDVKRLESGGVPLQLRNLRADDVVHDVMRVFRPIAEAREVALHVDMAGALPLVRGDHPRLVQVLSNLMSNALKFTEPPGAVTVSVRATGDVVLFAVADAGIGIAPEHLPRVFDRFWQVRREGKKGLGLGLAIARGIVEAHGGRIWVESTPGEGTTFLFSVPAATGEPVQAAAGTSRT